MQVMKITASRILGMTLAFALMVMIETAWAADADMKVRLSMGGTVDLVAPLFKSNVVELDRGAARISVGSPDIADILILRATQLYVLGKDIGTTNVLLWDKQDVLIGTLNVEVTHDLQSLKGKLHDINVMHPHIGNVPPGEFRNKAEIVMYPVRMIIRPGHGAQPHIVIKLGGNGLGLP